jgi:hypothetical protein
VHRTTSRCECFFGVSLSSLPGCSGCLIQFKVGRDVSVGSRYLVTMRWYARPENNTHQLRVVPRLASWNKAGDPDQVRLRAYLDDTEALLAASRIDGQWALRLDVGLPTARDLLDVADLDNYAYPLAHRTNDPGLVSVWCTKQHNERSLVRIEAARELSPPSTDALFAKQPHRHRLSPTRSRYTPPSQARQNFRSGPSGSNSPSSSVHAGTG